MGDAKLSVLGVGTTLGILAQAVVQLSALCWLSLRRRWSAAG
jgi:peptidoglycan biosynthesis protein MviN/MurJ (putative lipid II flippase)